MLKSMTGYGKGEATTGQGTFSVEIRSVNNRYGEISIRMPRSFMALETDLKRIVSSILKRGKIDVFVQWEEAAGVDSKPELDHALAKCYFDKFSKLATELALSEQFPLALIISQKGVLRESRTELNEDECREQLFAAVQSAVLAIDNMRTKEGDILALDLLARRKQLAKWVETIKQWVPALLAEYHLKLKGRLEQLLEGVELDQSRLAQEVAQLADRCDITEELVRLGSHFKQFDEAVALSEPVGRKLDFIMQEMNREVNTIGSKSSSAEISSLVIHIKAEMEKMREQVQNVE